MTEMLKVSSKQTDLASVIDEVKTEIEAVININIKDSHTTAKDQVTGKETTLSSYSRETQELEIAAKHKWNLFHTCKQTEKNLYSKFVYYAKSTALAKGVQEQASVIGAATDQIDFDCDASVVGSGNCDAKKIAYTTAIETAKNTLNSSIVDQVADFETKFHYFSWEANKKQCFSELYNARFTECKTKYDQLVDAVGDFEEKRTSTCTTFGEYKTLENKVKGSGYVESTDDRRAEAQLLKKLLCQLDQIKSDAEINLDECNNVEFEVNDLDDIAFKYGEGSTQLSIQESDATWESFFCPSGRKWGDAIVSICDDDVVCSDDNNAVFTYPSNDGGTESFAAGDDSFPNIAYAGTTCAVGEHVTGIESVDVFWNHVSLNKHVTSKIGEKYPVGPGRALDFLDDVDIDKVEDEVAKNYESLAEDAQAPAPPGQDKLSCNCQLVADGIQQNCQCTSVEMQKYESL